MSLDRAPPGSAASPERDALYREYPMWTDPARPGWLRRHKTLVAVGVVALLLVISAGVIAAITTARSDSGDAANAESIARTPSAASPIDPTASPSPTATVSPSPSPASTAFPNAANTGVPEGTNLTAYTGPCTITAANTAIVEKIVGVEWVTVEDSGDDERIEAAAAATRAAQQERRAQYLSHGRHYTSPSLHPMP